MLTRFYLDNTDHYGEDELCTLNLIPMWDDLSEKMEELVGDANIIFEECHALLETIPPKYFPPARPDSDSKD